MGYSIISEIYPTNLLNEIFNSNGEKWDVDRLTEPENVAGLELAVSLLKERDQQIIYKRFKENKSLQKIGDELSLTRERVRQLLFRALRSLQRQESRRLILFGRKDYDARQAQQAELRRKAPPIEELELDTRSYNALRHAKILTIPQLVHLSDKELSQIPNLGAKSFKTTRKAIEKYLYTKAKLLSFS